MSFKTKYTRTLIFSFGKNEASVIEHITPIYFPVYFVGVVLHSCVNECTPTIGLAILGYIISKVGISMDPSKVQDVLSWNVPTSVGDIQSFLRLARYYRRFIEGFSKISKPVTELLKKDKKFKWTLAREASFQELKK
jgi:hypothetical protein